METGFPDLAPEAPPRPQGNGMGVAGFVISLVGILTCGLLSPLAFIFSLIGLRRQPKGLAIAGTVLSALGTLMLAGSIYFVRPAIGTAIDAVKIYDSIEDYHREHGEYPGDEEAAGILGDAKDGWGTPFRYRHTADGYELLSAGFDRRFGTGDDLDLQRMLNRRR